MAEEEVSINREVINRVKTIFIILELYDYLTENRKEYQFDDSYSLKVFEPYRYLIRKIGMTKVTGYSKISQFEYESLKSFFHKELWFEIRPMGDAGLKLYFALPELGIKKNLNYYNPWNIKWICRIHVMINEIEVETLFIKPNLLDCEYIENSLPLQQLMRHYDNSLYTNMQIIIRNVIGVDDMNAGIVS